jgi:hypothetical protein
LALLGGKDVAILHWPSPLGLVEVELSCMDTFKLLGGLPMHLLLPYYSLEKKGKSLDEGI